jgi:hypothetical protein
MSKSKHSDAQIIAALKQVEADGGRRGPECGVSKHTIYAWFGPTPQGGDSAARLRLRILKFSSPSPRSC